MNREDRNFDEIACPNCKATQIKLHEKFPWTGQLIEGGEKAITSCWKCGRELAIYRKVMVEYSLELR